MKNISFELDVFDFNNDRLLRITSHVFGDQHWDDLFNRFIGLDLGASERMGITCEIFLPRYEKYII